MSTFFIILMAIAMLATLGALFIGLIGFAKGGEFNKRHGNKLMRLRLYMQAAAIACFALAVLTQVGGA